MKIVETLKPVVYQAQIVKSGTTLEVPDHTAEHWIATEAAREPLPEPAADELPAEETEPAARGGKKRH